MIKTTANNHQVIFLALSQTHAYWYTLWHSPLAPALTPLATSQYRITLYSQYCLGQPSKFTLDSLSSPTLTHSAFNLHNLFKTASRMCVCLFPIVCLRVRMFEKKAIILKLNELNETVTLTSAPLFGVWLSHTLAALAYIQWTCVAMNANPSMSAIFINFQTPSNNSQSLSLSLSPTLTPRLSHFFPCCVH